MPVDIIGMITATPGAEVDVPGGAAVQPEYVRRFAQAHEAAGFDQILVGHFSNAADGFIVSAFAAAATERAATTRTCSATAISCRTTRATGAPANTSTC